MTLKRSPRIFKTDSGRRYIIIKKKKVYIDSKLPDNKLAQIVINNIVNESKRKRKTKSKMNIKKTGIKGESGTSAVGTNSIDKYNRIIQDLQVEKVRNEVKNLPGIIQKQVQQQLTGMTPPAITSGTTGTTPQINYTPQLTNLQTQLTTMQKDIANATKKIMPTYYDDKNNVITEQQYKQLEQDRQKQIADATKQLTQASNQLSNTNAKLQAVEKQLLTKEKDVKDKEDEIIKLQNDVSKLMAQKTNSDQELKKNQNEIIRLSNQITDKEKDLMNEQIKVGDLQNKVIELEKTKTVFESNIQSLKQQEDDIKQKNEDLEKINKKLEADKKNVLKAQTKAQYDDAIDMGNLKGKIKVPFLDGKTQKIATYQYDSNGNIYQSEISYKYGKNEISNLMKKYNITTLKDDPYEYAKSIAKEELQKQIPKLDIPPVEEIPEPEQPESPPLIEKEEVKVPDAPKKPEQPPDEKAAFKIKTKKGKKGHEEAKGDGMYDYELDEIMAKYKPDGYLGCFTLDSMKKINPGNKKKISFFLNHNEHWCAVYIDAKDDLSVEYFNPFSGNPPSGFKESVGQILEKMKPEVYLKYKINGIPQQKVSSDSCGAIAARFLMDRYEGKTFKQATNYTIEKSEKLADKLRGLGKFPLI